MSARQQWRLTTLALQQRTSEFATPFRRESLLTYTTCKEYKHLFADFVAKQNKGNEHVTNQLVQTTAAPDSVFVLPSIMCHVCRCLH
mmetsp:Transcript_72726/g.144148  ORF Transcript_72726/g.144148 Transcript_72726/m.144148 type:complete len:87 (-) Transcript_72726:560-820(-)